MMFKFKVINPITFGFNIIFIQKVKHALNFISLIDYDVLHSIDNILAL